MVQVFLTQAKDDFLYGVRLDQWVFHQSHLKCQNQFGLSAFCVLVSMKKTKQNIGCCSSPCSVLPWPLFWTEDCCERTFQWKSSCSRWLETLCTASPPEDLMSRPCTLSWMKTKHDCVNEVSPQLHTRLIVLFNGVFYSNLLNIFLFLNLIFQCFLKKFLHFWILWRI